MPLSIPVALALAGGSVASGALAGRNRKVTTRTELTPSQSRAESAVTNRVLGDLNTPATTPNVQPLVSRSRGTINRAAKSGKSRLESDLASRGFERSGQLGAGFERIEAGRLGAFSDLEAQIIQFLETNRQEQEQLKVQNALRLLPNQSNVSQETSGGAAAGGVSGGLESLSMILVLNELLGGGGGGSLSNTFGSGSPVGP